MARSNASLRGFGLVVTAILLADIVTKYLAETRLPRYVGVPVLTTDRAWRSLRLSIRIEVIR